MHGWVSAGKPSSPPVFMMSQLQPIPTFPTPHPGLFWRLSMGERTLVPEHEPYPLTSASSRSCHRHRAWQLSQHGHRLLFSWGIQWVGTPFLREKETPHFVAWTACGSGWEQRESKGGAVGCFPCQQRPCVLYSLCLARKVGFSFPIWIIPPQKRSSVSQYTAAYFYVSFHIIAYHWLRWPSV